MIRKTFFLFSNAWSMIFSNMAGAYSDSGPKSFSRQNETGTLRPFGSCHAIFELCIGTELRACTLTGLKRARHRWPHLFLNTYTPSGINAIPGFVFTW